MLILIFVINTQNDRLSKILCIYANEEDAILKCNNHVVNGDDIHLETSFLSIVFSYILLASEFVCGKT